MAEQIEAKIKISKVETEEEPFIPSEKELRFVLEPIPGEEPFLPPEPRIEPFPVPPALVPGLTLPPAKPLCIDIETTGIMPYDSRIICISVLDPANPEQVITFYDESEEKLVREFLDFFRFNNYTQLIGYNVSFDYRFIFVKAMKYKLNAKEFFESELFDLMQVMKQVKTEFVFGFNKPGKLAAWSEYLLGIKKPITLKQVLKLWSLKAIDEIIEANKVDVQIIYLLWLLYLMTKGEIVV